MYPREEGSDEQGGKAMRRLRNHAALKLDSDGDVEVGKSRATATDSTNPEWSGNNRPRAEMREHDARSIRDNLRSQSKKTVP